MNDSTHLPDWRKVKGFKSLHHTEPAEFSKMVSLNWWQKLILQLKNLIK